MSRDLVEKVAIKGLSHYRPLRSSRCLFRIWGQHAHMLSAHLPTLTNLVDLLSVDLALINTPPLMIASLRHRVWWWVLKNQVPRVSKASCLVAEMPRREGPSTWVAFLGHYHGADIILSKISPPDLHARHSAIIFP